MTSRRAAATALAIILLAAGARSEILTARIVFDAPALDRRDGGVFVSVGGCRSIGRPGEPMIPVRAVRFILPPGERVVDVAVEPEGSIEIPVSFDLLPMPPQAPPGSPAPRAGRDESIYLSSLPFPARRGELDSEQSASGVRIAFVNAYPCVYLPAERRILFSPALRVTVRTAPNPDGGAPAARPERALRLLGGSVENPGAASLYRLRSTAEDVPASADLAQYVIVTAPEFVAAFEPLAALKTSCGMRARVVDTAWIAASFPGADLQERIRAFISHAYESWGAEYVLLGGDDEIVPHRGLYAKVGATVDPDVASDLYYACLDGTWNADGDAYFGEPGEEDLLPEVCVGRLPVDSTAEIANVIAKIARYQLSPVAPQCESALMLGELLWSENGVDTWGGDYKDEILFGSSSWGFDTQGVPPFYGSITLYDRDLGSWNAAQLLPVLNAGVHLVNHAGHANIDEVMRLSGAQVPLLANDGVSSSHFICWSHGCYAASFDNRDPAGAVRAEDCIAEKLLTGPCGAVAFIGHTRLGWDAPGSTCGVSQFFDRRFFGALFGGGSRRLGEAHDRSRVDNAPYVSYGAVRWVYYTLTLLGDPALPVWTAEPRRLDAEYSAPPFAGQDGFAVRVSDDGGPVAGARVVLDAAAPGPYREAFTDAAGEALVDFGAFAAGDVLLSIVSPDHYPYHDTITVAADAELLCSARLLGVRDDSLLSRAGDGDGVAEPGERIALVVLLANAGSADLTGVEISLASADTAIRIIDGSRFVGNLGAGSETAIDDAFSVEILANGGGPRLAPIVLAVAATEGTWRSPQLLLVSSPAVALESWSITDAPEGDGDGCLDAWEFQNFICSYRNAGSTEARGAVLSLSIPEIGFARVVRGTVESAAVPPGGSFGSAGELLWFVAESTPPFTPLTLVLTLSGENIPTRADTIRVRTCGFEIDDHGESEEPFDHRAIAGMDQWHVSGERFRSAPSSWKCGGADESPYANISESALTLPPLCLFTGSTLTFWHRMEAEAGAVYPYWALDAAVAEISRDGGLTWTILAPATPYPSRASPYNTIFLAPYQRCWSGAFDWRFETFDLSAYSGPVLVRFHFASDEQRGFEGWHIDDIRVTTVVPTDAGGPQGGPATTRLDPAYPNPFNPSTVVPYALARDGAVEIKIFDASGRLVRTLVDRRAAAGRYAAVWDGRDDRGKSAASGVYFCRLAAGAYTATTRLVLVR